MAAKRWYYQSMGEDLGPLSSRELKHFAESGRLAPVDLVRLGEGVEWVPASRVKGLFQEHVSQPAVAVHVATREAIPLAAPATRQCPWCAESIALNARKCKHCGEILDGSLAGRSARGCDVSIPTVRTDSASLIGTMARMEGEAASPKKILPALLLLFFFGGLGIHAFYAGRAVEGVIYILLLIAIPFTLGFSLLLIAAFVFADFIRLVVGVYIDDQGRKLTEWT